MLGTVAAELGGPSPPAEMLQWTAGVSHFHGAICGLGHRRKKTKASPHLFFETKKASPHLFE